MLDAQILRQMKLKPRAVLMSSADFYRGFWVRELIKRTHNQGEWQRFKTMPHQTFLKVCKVFFWWKSRQKSQGCLFYVLRVFRNSKEILSPMVVIHTSRHFLTCQRFLSLVVFSSPIHCCHYFAQIQQLEWHRNKTNNRIRPSPAIRHLTNSTILSNSRCLQL